MNNCMNYTIVLNSGLLFVENPHPFPKWEIQVLQFVWTEILIPHSRQKSESPSLHSGNSTQIFVWHDCLGEGIVFRKTVVGDWHFDYLSGSHLQSQEKSRRQMMVFMSLVLVLIGQFCRDVIGRQNMKVVVIGWLLLLLFWIHLLFVGFVWGHVWVICKVQVAVDISSEVIPLGLSHLPYTQIAKYL